jgi:hypothetical protein
VIGFIEDQIGVRIPLLHRYIPGRSVGADVVHECGVMWRALSSQISSMEPNDGDAASTPMTVEPGSSAWIEDFASGSGYHALMDLMSSAKFAYNGDAKTLDWTWYLDTKNY